MPNKYNTNMYRIQNKPKGFSGFCNKENKPHVSYKENKVNKTNIFVCIYCTQSTCSQFD